MSSTAPAWSRTDDRCYHGTDNSRISVELFTAKRSDPEVLGQLAPNGPAGEFSWGYIGTGTNTSAKAILSDALGYEPTQQLWQDFADDVLSQCPAEFRLRRGAVLRWVRGWADGYGIANLPEPLRALPPIDHTAYRR
ncbi:DUF6166 domain-containing protein [Actinoplanes sp. CA-051413]|uniref:DUF6166 domain-containing protein n=1 Tax=Actinoplanes sp. CA-051413 TaxID=3239899 RepID=UPI003D988825